MCVLYEKSLYKVKWLLLQSYLLLFLLAWTAFCSYETVHHTFAIYLFPLVLRKGPDGTVLPPTAHNRKKLYEEKYGEAGTTILSLETALQWKFNKVTDTCSPILWPALPLRLIYDET